MFPDVSSPAWTHGPMDSGDPLAEAVVKWARGQTATILKGLEVNIDYADWLRQELGWAAEVLNILKYAWTAHPAICPVCC